MPTTFEKLNLKHHTQILVLNAPSSFEPELARLRNLTLLRTLPSAGPLAFTLAFVTRQHEVDTLAPVIAALAAGDPILWFAFPKQSSKTYRSEISRDQGWEAVRTLGFDTVRAVAIDSDWSALRFRRNEFIHAHRRLSALSPATKTGLSTP